MPDVVYYAAAIFVLLHGLVHLLGLFAYYPLAELEELPYKTSLLNGAWEIGAGGMRFFSLLWFAATVGFVIAGLGMIFHLDWWLPLIIATSVFAFIISAMDYKFAFLGAGIDGAILAAVLIVPYFTDIEWLS